MNYYLHHAIDAAIRALANESHLDLVDFVRYVHLVAIQGNKATATLSTGKGKYVVNERLSVDMGF